MRRQTPPSSTPPSHSGPVPLTLEALHTRGFISDEGRDRLQAYLRAAKEYEDAFGPGPGIDAVFGAWDRAREGVDAAVRALEEARRREVEAREGVTVAAGEQAKAGKPLVSGPMSVLLADDLPRLEGLRGLVSRLSEAAEARAAPRDLAELARELSGAHQRLLNELRAGR